MADNFPSNKIEALAYLYVQQQDCKDMSPAAMYECYKKAYDEIKQAAKSKTSIRSF